MIIKSLKARETLNSRGEPTIEVVVNGKYSAAAPSGASTGKHEVVAYTKGVAHAVNILNGSHKLDGFSVEEFCDLKKVEDAVPFLGANPMVALEFALLKAASSNNIWQLLNPNAKKLPMPVGNCIGGGVHVKGREGHKPDIQEFLLIPNAETFAEAASINKHIHSVIGKKLKTINVTDEGAWSPDAPNEELLSMLSKAAEEAGRKFDCGVRLGVDMAASTFWERKQKKYFYKNFSFRQRERSLGREEQIMFVNSLIADYGLFYVEDPLHEEDFEGFSLVKKGKSLICGDDLVCTNASLLKKAIRNSSVNTIIVKPNQIGSLIKTREIVKTAFSNGITPVISHRSGETMDSTISHLAVGWGIPFIKCGIQGKEREAKILELMRIEKQLGL